MDIKPAKGGKLSFLLTIVFLQSMVYLTVFFDAPTARQVLGFFYFTFLPGFIILKLLKLDEFDRVEIILFSVGLSVAFIMFVGLLINEFCLLFGVLQPLSLIPLMIVLNSLVLMGGVLVHLKSKNVKTCRCEPKGKYFLVLLFAFLPILSISGAMCINVYGNNLLLLFMMILISVLVIVGVLSKKSLPSNLYPLAVFTIAIALLYHSALISNYLVSFGSDSPSEYFVFKFTKTNAYWSHVFMYPWDTAYGRLQSMLSITILPSVYSCLLGLDATWIFKILYPLIFSFVPLALYKLWQKQLGAKIGFIATFLFMAQNVFYTEILGLNRQMIAELFFILLLLVVLNKKIYSFKKTMLFTLFSFALVTSHYALAEIFLFFVFLAWIILIMMKRSSRIITATIIVLFFTIMFIWYLYTSNSAVFESFVSFGDYVVDQLDQFFNPASRGQTVLRGLGLESPPTIWNAFSRVFAYLTEFLIAFGFLALITKRTSIKLEREYSILTTITMTFLAALISVPGLAETMNMTRFYHILLFFLAPLCVLGADFFVKLIFKRRTEFKVSILLLMVLVPYFLFQVNFVYEVTGNQSWSLPLSKHRMDPVFLKQHTGYFDESEVLGALWMSKYVDVKNSKTYAEFSSAWYLLNGYGLIYGPNIKVLSNVTIISSSSNVYLNRVNVVDDVLVGSGGVWNTTSMSHIFDFTNKIYSNGMCNIYKSR